MVVFVHDTLDVLANCIAARRKLRGKSIAFLLSRGTDITSVLSA
jgi:hypothetical protein